MNVLITGARGFIGNAFIEYLKAKDEYTVYSLSNSTTYHKQEKHFFINLTDKTSLQELMKDLDRLSIDIIYHFAGVTPFNNRFDFETDLKMAEHIAYLCNKLHIPKMMYASGWIVYDKTNHIPIYETAPTNPSTDYGQSKLRVENYFKKNLSQTSLYNIRLASLFGPGQTTAGLIPNLAKTAWETKMMTVDAPKIKRDYLYIDNALLAFEKLMKAETNSSLELNIGSGKSHSRRTIAEMIQKIFQDMYGRKIGIKEQKNVNRDEMYDNRMSIEASEKLLGKYNHIDLEEGLRRYLNWFILLR